MYGLMLAVFVIVCILLIIGVLLQAGKGADVGAVFGGAGGQALFGSAGPADFLNKATRVLAVLFMLMAIVLGYTTKGQTTKSVMDDVKPVAVEAPAVPAEAAPAAE